MKEKMESPFISYLYIKIPSEKASVIKFNDKSIETKFTSYMSLKKENKEILFDRDDSQDVHESNKNLNYKEYFSILNEPNGDYRLRQKCKGKNSKFHDQVGLMKRTEWDDPLLKFMKDEHLLPSNFSFAPNQHGEIGCVVTKEFIQNLGYGKGEADFLYIKQPNKQYGDFYNPIPIRAIVESLPDDLDVLLGNVAFSMIEDWNTNHRILCCKEKRILNGDTIPSQKNDIKNYVFIPDGNSAPIPKTGKGNHAFFESGIKRGSSYYLSSENQNYYVQNKDNLDLTFMYDYYGLKITEPESLSLEVYAVKFDSENLDKIGEFSDFISSEFDLDVDMRIIENKNNFYIIDKITKILSYSLIILSILSLVLFKTSLFMNHISQNKKNLGTLKAFGISNNEVIVIYSLICFIMVVSSFFIAYTISYLFGPIIIEYLSNWLGIIGDGGIQYTSYSIKELLGFFIILPILVVVYNLFTNLHKKTPGDLIYDR